MDLTSNWMLLLWNTMERIEMTHKRLNKRTENPLEVMVNSKHTSPMVIIYLTNKKLIGQVSWQQIYKGQLKILG